MAKSDQKHLFNLYRARGKTADLAALFAMTLHTDGRVDSVEFRYVDQYRSDPSSIPVLPDMPLHQATYAFSCSGDGVPGFIDELLPDSWGRTLIARALLRAGLSRNPHVADLLQYPSGALVGCFFCEPFGQQRDLPGDGLHLIQSGQTADAAYRVDANQGTEEDLQRLSLAGASSPKGARPKFLCVDETGFWLAKLERQSDGYDVLLAEHTALSIAREAGLQAPATRIEPVGQRRVLLVERFDRDPQGNRLHIISANTLLKDAATQMDCQHGAYEQIAGLIRKYSINPRQDLYQLLGQMLLNSALRNTDDHLRNFSFLIDEAGVRLSPAYDIVPTSDIGAYHQLSWNNGVSLPALSQAGEAAQRLSIERKAGEQLGRRLGEAIKKHAKALETAGVRGVYHHLIG